MQIIEAIWNEYHLVLYRFIQSRVSNVHTAEDILQDVFLKIQRSIHKLREKSKLKSFLYQITRNTIIDHYRTRKKTEKLSELIPAKEQELVEKERQAIAGSLFPAIQALPERYREAVTLSDIEGLAQKQIAIKQGISLSGAKSRVQRGRAKLKKTLNKDCSFQFDRGRRVIGCEAKTAKCKSC
ncbi:RNA polymerase sigma factor SigZ [Candidatus Riflebacteria bacterium]